MPNILLKPMEVARRLGICRAKTYELISKGVIPSVHIGRSVRVSEESLERWLATLQASDGRRLAH